MIILTCTYLFKETITVPNTGTAAAPINRNKKVILKNCVLFTDCISDSNNKEIDHAKDIDVAISMYNLIKYSDNYSKTSVRLWQYYRDESFINNNVIVMFLVILIVLHLNLNKK